MKIGVYKPFKELMFVDDTDDNASWSPEVVNMMKILADNGNEIFVLTPNDLHKDQDGDYANRGIYDFSEHLFNNELEFDRIIIWCGSFHIDAIGDEIIPYLKARTKRLDFFLSDIKLVPENIEYVYMFDNIYIQSTMPFYTQDDKFGAISELYNYKLSFDKTVDESIKDKDIEFYFGGTERNRLDDFIEYVWRPEHVITTKTQFFDFENRVPRDEFYRNLERAKYSVVITDVDSNNKHFILPRQYELYKYDVVTFFDHKYDADNHFKKHPMCTVNGYKEMRTRMNEINDNDDLYKEIIEYQRKQIIKEFVDGTYVYGITK